MRSKTVTSPKLFQFTNLLVLSLMVLAAPIMGLGAPSSGPSEKEYIADVPNVDWSGLDSSERERATRILNHTDCPCGCGMTLAQCRRDDESCPHSPVLAATILADVERGKSDEEIVRSLSPATPEAEDESTIARLRLDLPLAPSVGPPDAPVTLVELIDYQCPFCARADATIERIRRTYGDKVRWVVVHNPLDFHPDAGLAAQAVLAAAELGKFLPMHRRLLESQDRLGRDELIAYATELGLPPTEFQIALDSGRYGDRVSADQALAVRIGATSTPFFFVNGRPVRGAQPFSTFESLIEEELSGELRPARWVDRVPNPPRPPAAQARPPRLPEDPDKVYELDLAGAIARGPEDAPITLVEFTDFECSYCAEFQRTLRELEVAYPNRIRWVAMNRPLTRIHSSALPAALAALAAERQGKYWEYRELLFSNQSALSEESLRGYAEQLGLDLAIFDADRNGPEILEALKREVHVGNQAEVRGTPTLFINGKKLAGLKSLGILKAMIEDILAARGHTTSP